VICCSPSPIFNDALQVLECGEQRCIFTGRLDESYPDEAQVIENKLSVFSMVNDCILIPDRKIDYITS